MFDRQALKTAARNRLDRSGRWHAVVVLLIASLFGAASGKISYNFEFTSNDTSDIPFFSHHSFEPEDMVILLFAVIAVMLVSVIAIGIGIFITNVILVGVNGWFLRYSRGDVPSLGDIFGGFQFYRSAVISMFLKDLLVFLWSLLFLIPGIVKGYAYMLTPYIINENPHLLPSEAVNLSEKMMNGWKSEAFALELSFLGWRILNIFTLGLLGVLYVEPYAHTSYAYFYETVKYDALYRRCIVDPSVFTP